MEHLTTAQAAFVVGAPLDIFKKVVERAPIKPQLVKRGGRSIRQFGQAELVFLHAYDELKLALTPKSQSEFYEALQTSLKRGLAKEVVFGKQRYDIGQHLVFVERKLKELEKLTDQVDLSGKEPVIRGTHIEAHRIAALLDAGATVEEVLRDYPSLKEQQVVAARVYAEAHPKAGRPYPKQTAKAAMRAADLSALDD
ncbi:MULTISPECIES: DUF433 domain-containing protein [Hyphomicrobiales]|uniref:DUF433 domain-containing protein n=7 Tax=Rhizobium/Agrobacterium group TaxID=227290 RepID=A0A2Z2PMP4_9HYPH|nr:MULTISPECIES: DUF433 domain-containing protein [Rhizobium/Agrobacterium group]KAA6481544.1 DUF433 domain-containing protein [Agrobacterium sp. ICMP 7243]ARU12289.1 hypothetical protein AgrTiEU6_58 [Agrobacterium tumefaciens]ASK43059.1 hypothetical protein [Agrobacterium deltaense]ASK43464.1 hypothetical protein [Agrobacterium radiobacter]ASK44028.1 hypothetical protein [Agrobacterium fabrum]